MRAHTVTLQHPTVLKSCTLHYPIHVGRKYKVSARFIFDDALQCSKPCMRSAGGVQLGTGVIKTPCQGGLVFESVRRCLSATANGNDVSAMRHSDGVSCSPRKGGAASMNGTRGLQGNGMERWTDRQQWNCLCPPEASLRAAHTNHAFVSKATASKRRELRCPSSSGA